MSIQNKCYGIKHYRFQPCFDSDGSLRAQKISPDHLWFSTPMNLNDPMDIDHSIDDLMRRADGDSPVLRAMAKVMYADGQRRVFPEFITNELFGKIRQWAECDGHSLDVCDHFRERMLQLGVACFTPEWNSPPMWAHYAENWKGFAIEYCVRKPDVAASNEKGVFWPVEVNYSSRIEPTSLSELLFSPYEAGRRILSAKTLPWSYENEWRLVHLPGGDQSVRIPIGMHMTGIILGPKSPGGQTDLLTEKCAEWALPLRQLHVGLDRNLHLDKAVNWV